MCQDPALAELQNHLLINFKNTYISLALDKNSCLDMTPACVGDHSLLWGGGCAQGAIGWDVFKTN